MSTKSGEQWTRIWMGSNVSAWLLMLWRARFEVSWKRMHIALAITIWSVLNSLGGFLLQKVVFMLTAGRREVPGDIVFIVGHWRTGTTFLHNLLSMHRDVSCPTTWECFAPNVSLFITEGIADKFVPLFLPASRPMDDVKMSWWEPQEHEFAMLNMGHRSPYLRFVFPYSFNGPGDLAKLLALSAREKQRWVRDLRKLLQIVAYRRVKRDGKKASAESGTGQVRLVLKNPSDTCRIDLLGEAFPGARFIWMHRKQEDVIKSTVKLWRRVGEHEGLQPVSEVPVPTEVVEADFRFVLETAERMQTASLESRTIHVDYDAIDSMAAGNSPEVILQTVRGLGQQLDLDPSGWDVPATLRYLEEVRASQQAYLHSSRK